MGATDLLKPVIERSLGGNIRFGRVAIKPGTPSRTPAALDEANIVNQGNLLPLRLYRTRTPEQRGRSLYSLSLVTQSAHWSCSGFSYFPHYGDLVVSRLIGAA